MINLLILITKSLDNLWIWLEENWCWSPLGLKGLRTMQRNVPSKSLQWCDVFLLAGGGGGYNFNFPLNLPQTLLLVCLVFRRGDAGRRRGGSWWGRWGGIGSKMCKNLVPPIFPRSIKKGLLFNLSCLNDQISIAVITNQELSGHVIKIYIKFL